MIISSKQIKVVLTTVGLFLSLIFVAMQFSGEINWSIMDFVIMGTLLSVAGLVASYLWVKFADSKYRIVFILLVLLAVLLIWAELAVGIFD